MAKTSKKTKEEKVVEEYFPVDETDLKYSVEKETKEKPLGEEFTKGAIEKEYKKIDQKDLEKVEKVSKRKPRKKPKPKKYSPSKIKLKEDGYELIITEKPQAASKIAAALGTVTQKNFQKVPYYEVKRDGEKIIVASAVGHLFALTQETRGSKVPEFNITWTPNYLIKKNGFTKRYYDNLLNLAKSAGSLTVATDLDVEGEVIGLNIIRFLCGQKDANRMKFSTLTEKEINQAYEKKLPSIVWGQAIAGETRHYLDWFYGINLSRALMNAIKTTGKFRIMSIGRVQGPALNLIVQKEKEIQKFKSKPYWQVFITIDDGKNQLKLKHNKDIFNKEELNKFEGLIKQKAEAKTEKKQERVPPNPPFNLTTLQTEAYKFYGISPSNTLRVAQSLYLAGLISYPRTSSQKLPDSIDYKPILEKLKKLYKVSKLITKNKPLEGKKTDPAHPSIYPTGDKQILSGDEEKIYELIVKRFLSLFCDDAIIDKKKIIAKINKLSFDTRGSEIKKKSWLEFYPSKLKEISIPDMEGEVTIKDLEKEEKETQPPKRYSQASIISQLEKRNLGTKATRSTILETLYTRGYINEKSIEATHLGISLIETMDKYSPIIIDEKLTRSFEKEMESLTKLKKNFEKKETEIINKAKKTIIEISKNFEENEKEIGKELLEANIKLTAQRREENTLTTCPVCKKGNLAITYSKKTKRHFVACNAYPDCKTTYTLPPRGTLKKTNKACEECGFPLIMSLRKGKRPWIFCFNPACPTNKKKLEEYRKKQENKN